MLVWQGLRRHVGTARGLADARLRCARGPTHGGYAAVVAVRQFLQRNTHYAPSGGLFPLFRCEGRGRPVCFRRASARLLPAAVWVRSTSANPANTPISKRPMLVPVSAHRSPSFVIMKSQPGRSPPMRQVTSPGSWPPLPMPIAIAPPHPTYDRPPGSPHGPARMP
jgi:hypothetical protein